MDQQQAKGAIFGALGTAAVLTAGYLLSRGSNTPKKVEEPSTPRTQPEEIK
jgi:hypothetical protein